jgi:hypothetical protein
MDRTILRLNRFAIIGAAVAMTWINASRGEAGRFTISDGDFAAGEWSTSVLTNTASPGAYVSSQVSAGGARGVFDQAHFRVGAGQQRIEVVRLFEPLAYHPQSQGAIKWINFAMESKITPISGYGLPFTSSPGVTFSLAAFQDGTFFRLQTEWSFGFFDEWIQFTDQQVNIPSVPIPGIPDDYYRTISGPYRRLDYSSTAGPIKFGYYVAFGEYVATGRTAEAIGATDNWSVTVVTVPEPSAWRLLGSVSYVLMAAFRSSATRRRAPASGPNDQNGRLGTGADRSLARSG